MCVSVHEGVVKSVNMWDSHVFAIGGNEKVVKVVDTRLDKSVTVEIEDAHEYCINSVTWHPSNKNLLMSASFGTCFVHNKSNGWVDKNIHLWDMRKTTKPLFTYNGHISEKLSKYK